MAPVTFEDLLDDPFMRKVIRLHEDAYGSPLSSEHKSFIVDDALATQRNGLQERDWTRLAAELAEHIAEGAAHWAEYPLFWLKLYGVVFEYWPRLEKQREILEVVDFYAPVIAAFDSLMAKLTAEDLSFVAFMRHSHAHLYVGYVRHKAKLASRGRLDVTPPTNPDAEPLARMRIAEHSGSQEAAAESLASQIAGELLALAEAVEGAFAA